MKKLTVVDSMFLFLESRESMLHVGSLLVFKIPDDYKGNYFQELMGRMRNVDEFQAPFNTKLYTPPLNLGRLGWEVDKEFDLDYHIRHSSLPSPGTEQQLMSLVSRLHGTLLDRSRPLWEFHLIEGLEGNRVALYFKIHHAIMDGVSGMRMTQSILSNDPNDASFKPPWQLDKTKKKKKKNKVKLKDALEAMVKNITLQASHLPELSGKILELAKESFLKETESLVAPFEAPKSLLNVKISGSRRFNVTTLSLKEVRAVGKKLNASVNDVVMAVCGGALREYMLKKNDLPDKPIIAFVPVSTRAKDDDTVSNQLSSIMCSLGTHIADPIERIKNVKASSKKAKEHLSTMSKTTIENYTVAVGAPAIVLNLLKISSNFTPAFNLLISNIPGPREAMYLNGAKLEALYPVSFLFDGQGMNITLTSYMDNIDFGFIACRDAFPGIDQFADITQAAFLELKKATK